jgi:hypothetical protein
VTTRTRRRLFLCAVIAALSLPAEFILLKAVTVSPTAASEQWVGSLLQTNLLRAADEIQNYPLQYRKDIMKRLTPGQRKDVWVNHIATYRDARPELSAEQVDALNAAIGAAAATFTNPGDDTRAATRVVAERVQELFGADVAEYLMYRLGNKNTLILASALPWHQKLADTVRDRFVVQADGAGDCWCNDAFGCDLLALTWCDGAVTCTIDNRWPACGWFWDETCDGVCKIGGISG